MRQQHRNLFYSYRGGSPADLDRDFVFQRQLEDNATKALVNVLEHSDHDRVLLPFLSQFARVEAQDAAAVQFALQRSAVDSRSAAKQLALVIAPVPGPAPKQAQDKLRGRPDAWVWDGKSFAVLIETKVVGQASREQLQRHFLSAGWPRDSTVEWATWGAVHRFFRGIRRAQPPLDAISRLLVGEFVEYLNMTGMTDQTIFDIDDFGYFALSPENRSRTHKKVVSEKLHRFTEQLAKTKTIRDIVRLYAPNATNMQDYVNPGVFRDDSKSFWITIGPKSRREHCHLTIRISDYGIGLDVFAPHRPFTERLLTAIKRDTHGFLEALRGIPTKEAFVVRQREAYYKNPESSYKGQRIGHSIDYAEIHPSFFTASNVEETLLKPVQKRLAMGDLRPEVFLARRFGLGEVLEGEGTVETVAAAAQAMIPYLKWALQTTSRDL